jgi:hypothetical protein
MIIPYQALTFQKGGVAVNVNFIIDDSVYVSRHQSGAVRLPHNCVGLGVYDYADFQQMAEKALADGATAFTCVGNEDLPIPECFIG